MWKKIRATIEAGVNQRVTRMGLLFTLAMIVVALAAFSSANNLLFLILAAMLATLMISGLVSRLSLTALALDLILPEHICAGRKLTGRIVIQNEKRWMSSFAIHLAGYGQNPVAAPLYFPLISGGAFIEQPVDVFFDRRGSYAQNSFRFTTRFPFGFAERRVNVLVKREVLVYPSIDPQDGFEELLQRLNGEAESLSRGQGSDFYRIRPYEVLESARHVDWKATAHTGDLQIREFAREQERSVALFLDLDASEADRAWFERSVSCCAYLAWSLTGNDTRLHFRTQEVEILVPEAGDVYTILKYLATVEPFRGPLQPQFEERNSLQVVFSAAPEKLTTAGWDLGDRRLRVLTLGGFEDNAPKPEFRPLRSVVSDSDD